MPRLIRRKSLMSRRSGAGRIACARFYARFASRHLRRLLDRGFVAVHQPSNSVPERERPSASIGRTRSGGGSTKVNPRDRRADSGHFSDGYFACVGLASATVIAVAAARGDRGAGRCCVTRPAMDLGQQCPSPSATPARVALALDRAPSSRPRSIVARAPCRRRCRAGSGVALALDRAQSPSRAIEPSTVPVPLPCGQRCRERARPRPPPGGLGAGAGQSTVLPRARRRPHPGRCRERAVRPHPGRCPESAHPSPPPAGAGPGAGGRTSCDMDNCGSKRHGRPSVGGHRSAAVDLNCGAIGSNLSSAG